MAGTKHTYHTHTHTNTTTQIQIVIDGDAATDDGVVGRPLILTHAARQNLGQTDVTRRKGDALSREQRKSNFNYRRFYCTSRY